MMYVIRCPAPRGVLYPKSYHCLIYAALSVLVHATRSDGGTVVSPAGGGGMVDLYADR
jgi:hypothetical protein